MLNKQDVIIAGMSCGYFRAKLDDKRNVAMQEVKDAFPEENPEEVAAILMAETERRHVESQKRIAKQVARATEEKPVSSGYEKTVIDHIEGNAFVITVAQNNTDLHSAAFEAMKACANVLGAQLIVCRTYYNKNAFAHPEHGSNEEGIYFDPALSAYFIDRPVTLGKDKVLLLGNANVIPTAKSALAGFESMGESGQDVIIPAVNISLKCTAALKGSKGKRLFSTGAVTLKNYVMRKAGQVAEAHHSIGCVIIADDDIRHAEVMPGTAGFYYGLDWFGADGPDGNPVTALQFGDIHAEHMTPELSSGLSGLIMAYEPEHVILHDVCDFSSRNHHNRKDCTFIYQQELAGNSVVTDCNKIIALLDELASNNCQVHVIESNHDLAMERWLKEADPKEDATNAEFYHTIMGEIYRYMRSNGRMPNVLDMALTIARYESIGDNRGNKLSYLSCWDTITFHATDESVMLAGVEHGCHGHIGANGSKGSPNQFAKLGIPINTGHTHTPSIIGKCYTAGVSSPLDMGYNTGPSSWHNAHILTYQTGQRVILFS